MDKNDNDVTRVSIQYCLTVSARFNKSLSTNRKQGYYEEKKRIIKGNHVVIRCRIFRKHICH